MTQITSTHSLMEARDRTGLGETGPEWLTALRQKGAEDFASLGLPTTKHEEWRQTNVSAIEKAGFVLPTGQKTVDAAMLERFAIPEFNGHRLVFVDGMFAAPVSALGDLPQGVVVSSLAAAIESHADLVAKHLGQYVKTDVDAFAALNTAYLDDGVFVYVPAEVRVDKPIELLFVSTDDEQAVMSHPRVLMVVEAGGHVDVVEHHVGLADNVYFTNAVTEVVLGEKASASHIFIERDSREAFNVSTLEIHQEAHSDFASHTMLLGGKLVRNNVNPTFVGENCHSVLNGVYLPDDKRHLANHMQVHHKAPRCRSRQYYTGVLKDHSTGVFIGRIMVDRPAQQTDAVQSSRGLLLSDDAYLHTRPQLEIFADDVKCTHGATIGEIDKEAVFYLESRGIPAEVARGMMIYSFAAEALDRIDIEPVRRELARLLIRQLKLSNVEAVL